MLATLISLIVPAFPSGLATDSQAWRGISSSVIRVSAVVLHHTRYADSQLTTPKGTVNRPSLRGISSSVIRVSAVVLHHTRYADSQLTTPKGTVNRPSLRSPTPPLKKRV